MLFNGRANVSKIYACMNSSYIITEDGCVYSWGCNSDGQLGLSSFVDVEVPKKIERLPEIQELVIRGKQVIAMQFYEILDNGSGGAPEIEALPNPPPADGASSKGKSTDNEPNQRVETAGMDRHGTVGIKRMESFALSRHNTNRSKSVRSSSKKSVGGRSSASSRYQSRSQPFDKLGIMLKETIPIILEIYKTIKEIDEDIEKQFKERDTIRSNPVVSLSKKLNTLKEQCHRDFDKELSLDNLSEDKEYSEIKNFVIIMRKAILDSVALRSLQTIAI